MRVLIFGGTGMLGHKLCQVLSDRFDVWTTYRGSPELINDYKWFRPERTIGGVFADQAESSIRAIKTSQPDVVINAVGVIKQLPSSKDVTTSLEINSLFPHRLAELSNEFDYRLITVSTDCVFDGNRGNYSENDIPNAIDLYGQSKHWGEIDIPNCLTLRSSIIGHELGTQHSLVDWFLSNQGKTVNGYTKAIYSGFPTIVFADIIVNLITEMPGLSGLYHVSSDPINKFELLGMIDRAYGTDITINPSEDVRIDRSLDSRRYKEITGFQPPSWPEMIDRMRADAAVYQRFQ